MRKGLKRGLLTAAFLAVAAAGVVGIRSFSGGPSQPAQSPTSQFHSYSTAVGTDVTIGAGQQATSACPEEVLALKGQFTISGKHAKTYTTTLDDITAASLPTAVLYGFYTTNPAIEKTITTAGETGARLDVRIKNEVLTGNDCSASTLTIAGEIVQAKIVKPAPGSPRS